MFIDLWNLFELSNADYIIVSENAWLATAVLKLVRSRGERVLFSYWHVAISCLYYKLFL